MWPKALAQLIELAPHIARLLPMADRFFQAKTADAEASRSAMEQMAEGLRGDLGQVTASHAGLYRQLNEQSEKLSTIAAEVRSAAGALSTVDARLTRVEKKLTTLLVTAAMIGVAGVVSLVLLIVLLVRH